MCVQVLFTVIKRHKEADYQFLKVMCWLIQLFQSWYIRALLLFKLRITGFTSFKQERLTIQEIGTIHTVLTTVGKKSKWASLTKKKIRQHFE